MLTHTAVVILSLDLSCLRSRSGEPCGEGVLRLHVVCSLSKRHSATSPHMSASSPSADLPASQPTRSACSSECSVDRDSSSNKRAVVDGKDVNSSEEKRPKVVASLIHNIAPQRCARIGPQYQAEVPPWPPADKLKPSAGPKDTVNVIPDC